MPRVRNWPSNTYAEVFVRLDHGQPIARVARCTGLTYQQVLHFSEQMKTSSTHLPTNVLSVSADDVNRWHEIVRKEIEEEQKVVLIVDDQGVSHRKRPVEINHDELEAEIAGCIDLVRQAAAQFGMTPRKFLWLCSSSPRSA